jgi:uncharacterized protein YecT (DUF1311 family)
VNFFYVFLAVSLSAFVFSSSAYSADCKNVFGQTEMNECFRQEFQAADKRLNKIYSEYQTRLTKAQKRQLKAAQLTWIKFRDQSCDFQASSTQGGSAYQMVRYMCLTEKTRLRVKELKQLATCEEGDLSCPAWKKHQ